MTNPNPSRITNPMWRMWTGRPDSTWKLSGIFANKKCYHNGVEDNLRNWPGAYCCVLSSDLVNFNRDKARAIDYTMSDAKMRLYTARMRKSALDSNDDRLFAVRDFYGTLNSSTVYGLIKNGPNHSWKSSSADSTHLWHMHISIFTRYVNDWSALEPILSVLSGETYAQWKARRTGSGIMLPKYGDGKANGMFEVVRYWQRRLLRLGYKMPEFGADGEYGDEMQAAVTASRKHYGYGSPGTKEITGWHAEQMDTDISSKGEKGDPGPAPTTKQIASAVATWITSNSDSLKPTDEEIETIITQWMEEHKAELRGEPGKTPTTITFETIGKVTAAE